MVLRPLLLVVAVLTVVAFWTPDPLPAMEPQPSATGVEPAARSEADAPGPKAADRSADKTTGDTSANIEPLKPQPPPLRTHREVEAALGRANQLPPVAGAENQNQALRRLKIVLLASKKDHGPGEHDYPAWQSKWQTMLAKLPAVTIDTAFGWPSDEQWHDANLVICYYWNHQWSEEQLRQLDEFLARGGGLVNIHAASIHDRDAEVLAPRFGLAFQQPIMKWRHGPVQLKIEASPDEPITHGLPRTVDFYDESYWMATGDKSKVQILATTNEDGQSWPMLWTFEPGKQEGGRGRVVCCVMGHYMWTFDDPLFRLLILRSAAWAAGEPATRFQELATDNVRLIEDGKP